VDSDDLARRIGLAWEKLPEPPHPLPEIGAWGRACIYRDGGGVALRRLERDLEQSENAVVSDLERELGRN
jgi:hypothetical protein